MNDLDVLNGYPGAYTYPTHAFVRSLSRGQAELLQSGAARIPIYLQQYEFASDSPHHLLLVESDGDEVRIDFQWATSIRRPSAAPDVHGEMLLRREWEAAVRACVDSYLAAVRGLFARASVETRAAVEGMLADLG